MTFAPRLRLGLRRSSLLFWSATLVVAAATGLFVSHQAGEASARAARLGGLLDVPVAARPIPAGRVLRAVDVVVRRLPAAALPEAALGHSPTGRTVLFPLAAGEILLASKLAPEGLRGVAALLPPGMRALAVPVDPGALALERGHQVDVLATFDIEVHTNGATSGDGDRDDGTAAGEPTYAGGGDGPAGAPTFAVATDAVVLAAGEEAVTIAVSAGEAPRVAFAIARGTVTLALTGGA